MTAPDNKALLAALQSRQGRGFDAGGQVAPSGEGAKAIYDATVPWYVRDAIDRGQAQPAAPPPPAVPSAEQDPQFQNRFQGLKLPPGIDPGSAAPPRDIAPQWLQQMGQPQLPEPSASAAQRLRQPDPVELQAIIKALQAGQLRAKMGDDSLQNGPPMPAPPARA
jgi:hypothetical protein